MSKRCLSCDAIIPDNMETCPKCVSNKKPCYVCGAPKPWTVKILPERGILTKYFVECRMCHCCGPTRIGKHRAIKAWNKEKRYV